MPIIEAEDGRKVDWPNCTIPDCEYLVCLGADSRTLCYRHLSPEDRARYDAELMKRHSERGKPG